MNWIFNHTYIMEEKLKLLKTKVNNISGNNLELFKDDIDIFIRTYVKNNEKKNTYLKELNLINFSRGVTEYQNETINPWSTQRNEKNSYNWLIKWRNNLNDLIIKIENFLQSDINKEDEIKPIISAWTYIKAWWNIIVWNDNKNSHKKDKNWQDNIAIYIFVALFVGIILIVIQYFFFK